MDFAELERSAWTDPTVASAYEERFRQMVEGAIGPLLDSARVGRSDRLLDVACGPGRVAAAARGRGARVTLLDFSPAMLRTARPRNPGLELIEGTASRLPLRSRSFDAVVCNFGLLHLAEPDAALTEAARLLAPGGRTAWTVWAADAAAMRVIPDALEELRLTPSLPRGPPFFRFADPAEFPRALAAAGLTSASARKVGWSVTFSSPDEFLRMFEEGSARTRASLQALSTDDRTRLYELVRARLERYREGPQIVLPTAAVIGCAYAPA